MVPGNKSPVKTSGKSSPNKHHLTVKLGPPFKQKVVPITNIEANTPGADTGFTEGEGLSVYAKFCACAKFNHAPNP